MVTVPLADATLPLPSTFDWSSLEAWTTVPTTPYPVVLRFFSSALLTMTMMSWTNNRRAIGAWSRTVVPPVVHRSYPCLATHPARSNAVLCVRLDSLRRQQWTIGNTRSKRWPYQSVPQDRECAVVVPHHSVTLPRVLCRTKCTVKTGNTYAMSRFVGKLLRFVP